MIAEMKRTKKADRKLKRQEYLEKKRQKEATVLLVCESGGVSKKTSLRLRSKGLENVFYIKGGQSEWESAGLPTASLSE